MSNLKKLILLIFACCLIYWCYSNISQKPREWSIEQLEQKKAELTNLLDSDNISARLFCESYFELGDAFLQKHLKYEALNLYKMGLHLNSWAYEFQLKAAELELEYKQHVFAENRCRAVIKNSYNPIILYQAKSILNKISNVESQTVPLLDRSKYKLYILNLDNIPEHIMISLRNRISSEFKISVDTVQQRNTNCIIKTRLSEYAGLSDHTQFNADDFLSQLQSDYSDVISSKDSLGVLAITSRDLYCENYNFLFGWSSFKIGVMSIFRFKSNNTSLFTKRTIMQAFASVSYILGLSKCSIPACARVYPNSLEEHDRKEDILCKECIIKLNNLYKNLEE